MATLDNVLSILERWGEWKLIRATPSRLDELEGRVKELESRLKRAPGQACPSCGALEYRVISSSPAKGGFGDLGAVDRVSKCQDCGFTETNMITPK